MVGYLVEPLSPRALPDAQASASIMVEPLSPMALPDAQASGSSGFRLLIFLVTVPSRLRSIGGNRSTISARRKSGEFCGFLKSHIESKCWRSILKGLR